MDENCTEQRVLASVDFLIDDSEFNIDSDLTHMYGHSMGGSGSLAFGMRYPSVFSGIYASEPMTNYATSPNFQDNFVQLWGEQSRNLPIINGGPDSGRIAAYDSNGIASTGVWDWMNHLEQLRRRSWDQYAYLIIEHGKEDTTIDWVTQGQPLARALTEARVGFSARARAELGHVWLGFSAVVKTMFGLGFGDQNQWRYPNSLSFPALTHASASSDINPTRIGDSNYNMNIEWSTPKNQFDEEIVDLQNQYQISLRSLEGNQTASVTPRNTRLFQLSAGQLCNWSVVSNANNQLIQSGSAQVDDLGLLTIDNVAILTDRGSRLTINC